MNRKEKFLIRCAIHSFMKDGEEEGEWEDGMLILSYLKGDRDKLSKEVVRQKLRGFKTDTIT